MHFCTVVLLSATSEDLQEDVARMLAPFDGNIEVPEYKEDCYCLAESPTHTPEANCEDCGGGGTILTTSNPQGLWTSWQIGGRFTGLFDPSYNPQKDPQNWQSCNVCGGTGARTDFAFYFVGEQQVAGVPLARQSALPTLPAGAKQRPWCNGCQGTGQMLKWPTEWRPFEGDIMLACNIPDVCPYPYAIVTPDGQWYQRREELGMTPEEVEAAGHEQNAQFRRVLAMYSRCVAVVCDLHS